MIKNIIIKIKNLKYGKTCEVANFIFVKCYDPRPLRLDGMDYYFL